MIYTTPAATIIITAHNKHPPSIDRRIFPPSWSNEPPGSFSFRLGILHPLRQKEYQ